MERSRLLVGGLVFGLLVALSSLLMVAPVLADQASITHTTLEDFNAGFLYHTGLTRYEDGEVQLLVGGIVGEWISDTNTTGLPALDRHTAVRYNDHIIVIGGRSAGQQGQNKVYYATINPDPLDHDLSAWQETTPLPSSWYPNGLYWHASVVIHDRLYVLGGAGIDDNDTIDTVAFAPINNNGTLGTWTKSNVAPLPEALQILRAEVIDDKIYVVGGRGFGSGSYWYNEMVYYATPNADTGGITDWPTTTESFLRGVAGHMVATYDNDLYVMAGFPIGSAPPEVSPYVNYAPVHTDTGDITEWITTTDIQINLYGAAGLSYGGVLYTTGGSENGFYNPSEYVRTAWIGPTGGVGVWNDTKVIAPKRFFHAAVVSTDGWLYIINGTGTGGALKNINRGRITGAGGDNYAPNGSFQSSIMDLEGSYSLQELRWSVSQEDPSKVGIDLYYRTASSAGDWSEWSGPHPSLESAGTITTTLSLSGRASYFQYRAELSQSDPAHTPVLKAVRLAYTVPAYQVQMSKESDPANGSTVKPGTVISYTMDYANNSEEISATNAYILDSIPDYATYKPGSIFGPGADDSDTSELRWDLGDLETESGGQVGFAVIVDPGLLEEVTISNQATIYSDGGPARSSGTVVHTVEPFVVEATLDKSAVPPPGSSVLPGATINYSIDYENSGELPLTGVVVTDSFIPASDYTILSSNPSVSGKPAVWNLGTLDVTESGSLQLAIQIADMVWPKDWVISNQALLNSLEIDLQVSQLVTHTISDPAQKYPDLRVEDIHLVDAKPLAGVPTSFRVTIANRDELAVAEQFWTELYIKPSSSPPPSGPSDHDGGYCVGSCASPRADFVEALSSLAINAPLTIPFRGENGQLIFPSEGTYKVCAQVDVAFGSEDFRAKWGAVPESDEGNNVRCETVIVGPPRVYLPMIKRNSQ